MNLGYYLLLKKMRWVRGDCKLICDNKGEPMAMIGSALDITTIKKNRNLSQRKASIY